MRRTFIAAPAVLSQFGASGSTQGSLHVTSSVSVRGWSIQSHMAPISSEAEADDIRDAIRAVAAAEGHAQISQLFALPEILFGSNALHLLLEDGTFELRISCKGALCQWARVAATAEDVPEVAAAAAWKDGSAASPASSGEDKSDGIARIHFDWTYYSEYAGEMRGSEEVAFGPVFPRLVPVEMSHIDMDLLRARDAMLFFDDITLFEDELHDNGYCRSSAKVRVMPRCWYILHRYFLRVDSVVMKAVETRIFHLFGSDEIAVDVKVLRMEWLVLEERGLSLSPKDYDDEDMVCREILDTQEDRKYIVALGPKR
mmetsp:Transcript_5355/g.21204  ORF Transcript_5355/g.21204 Transcript_5355/m.21204 type:complete len:314 (-) Transcript_5355:25-966(-)